MIQLSYKLDKAGKLLLNTWNDTSATEKEYLQLLEHRRITSHESPSVSFCDALPFPVEVYEMQILGTVSPMVWNNEAVEASNVFVKDIAALVVKRAVERFTVLPELFLAQTFQPKIMLFSSFQYKDMTSLKKGRWFFL